MLTWHSYRQKVRCANTELLVRPARREDHAEILRVVLTAFERGYRDLLPDSYIRRWVSLEPARWARMLEDENGLTLVAHKPRMGSTVCAVASAKRAGDIVDLSGCYVLAPGSGIGLMLVRERIGWAREQPGVRTLRTDVWDAAGTASFWMKHGFVIEEQYTSPYDQTVNGTILTAQLARVDI